MARFTKIIFFFIILCISFQAQAKNPPPGTAANVPANILIMLDVSGSMSATLYSGAQIYNPTDVAIDSSGNVYALETGGYIKIFNSSGTFLKKIGNGYGYNCNQWRYSYAFDIYDDQIYIADYYGGKIKVLDLNGNCIKSVDTEEQTYWWGWSYPANPTAIAVGSNYTYVAYSSLQKISIYDTSSLSLVRSYDSSSYTYYTYGLALNSSEDTLIATSLYTWSWYLGNGKPINKFTVSGSNLTHSSTIGTSGYTAGNGEFQNATGAAFDSNDNIYVSDQGRHVLQKLNSSGTYQTKAGTGRISTTSPFYYPYGVTTDSSDNVYVADYYNGSIRKFDSSLNLLKSYGGSSGSQLDVAKKVIKKIVSDSNLTAGANFGFMTWASYKKIRVKIDNNGAKNIYNDIDSVTTGLGYGTNLNPAMTAAREYFVNGTDVNGKFTKVENSNLSCSKNYLIVISDGHWYGGSPNAIASGLNARSPGKVQTYVVGFNVGGSTTNYTSLAKAGGTTTPLFADNEKQLIEKLNSIIKQAVSSKSTYNTPAVMEEIKKGDFVYQSTFKYVSNGQWPGYLKKYKLNSDGSFGNEIWDASTKLNNKKSTKRNIWTTGLSTISTNNFTTTYRDMLSGLLFPNSSPTDDEIDDLINFIRGIDTYDEDADNNTTEERHKLNDIYHSELRIVGPVDGSTDDDNSSNFQKKDAYYRSINEYNEFKDGDSCGEKCSERKEVVFAGSNGGMLHAFDTSDGEELWAYIPANLLGKLSTIISNKANETNSIYGVDGSPVVKDIYYDDTPDNNIDDPSWRTIVLTGLGAGGHGYFALDITDVNSPKHLFTIENDPFNNEVKHWDSDDRYTTYSYDGGGHTPAEFDYRELGEAWSTPRIIRLTVSGKDKWVAVFGGGYNGAVNPNYGSAVFIMDLENEGKLLRKIGIPQTSNRIDTMVSSIPSDLTILTANGTDKANYSGAMVYAADLKGTITKINLTDRDESGNITSSPTYHKTVLFSAESGTNNERYIYHEAEATINDDDNLWLYFGTGDIQKLETRANTYNRIYGIKDKDFPNYKTINTPGTISQCKTAPNCPESTDLGWYINLKNSQKLTASVTVDNNLIHYPVYEPRTSDSCSNGEAIKCKADAKCGYKSSLGKACVKLGTGVLSKIVVYKEKLYIGIAGEAKTSGTGFTSKDNLITGASTSTAKKAGGKVLLEGWREN